MKQTNKQQKRLRRRMGSSLLLLIQPHSLPQSRNIPHTLVTSNNVLLSKNSILFYGSMPFFVLNTFLLYSAPRVYTNDKSIFVTSLGMSSLVTHMLSAGVSLCVTIFGTLAHYRI